MNELLQVFTDEQIKEFSTNLLTNTAIYSSLTIAVSQLFKSILKKIFGLQYKPIYTTIITAFVAFVIILLANWIAFDNVTLSNLMSAVFTWLTTLGVGTFGFEFIKNVNKAITKR